MVDYDKLTETCRETFSNVSLGFYPRVVGQLSTCCWATIHVIINGGKHSLVGLDFLVEG